jgi:hypothetical protein
MGALDPPGNSNFIDAERLACQLASQNGRERKLCFDGDDQKPGAGNVIGLTSGAGNECIGTLTLAQRRGERFNEQPLRFDVGAEQVAQLGGRLIERGALLPARTQRRDEVVNPAEVLNRSVAHRRQAAFIAKIHRMHESARITVIVLDRGARGLAAHRQHDIRAGI